jgi:biotin operon repressor
MVVELGSRAAVARRLGCSRAWITKALKVLATAPPSP